jgi:hypothetical protein
MEKLIKGGIMSIKNIEKLKKQDPDNEPELTVKEKKDQDSNNKKGLSEKQPEEKTERGIVCGCIVLAVRENATINSKILTTIPTNTKVTVDPDNSTKDFYKVLTKDGIEGFCMRSFIKI